MKLRRPTSVNPVLRRELLERWRSRRAPATLTIYLAILGGGLYLLYRIGVSVLSSQMGFGGPGGVDASLLGPILGRFLLESLLFFVLVLVLFVAPGYAAAQISGERERRTLSLLQVTLLSPLQIVLGKLGAAVAWLTLLVVATLPLGAAAFFLGGVGLGELLRGALYILVIAVSVAAMAIGVSSSTKRTTGSIVLTYGLVLALTGGTVFVSIAEYVFRSSRPGGGGQIVPVALYLNPAFGLADAVTLTDLDGFFGLGFGGPSLPSPLSLIAQALPRDDAAVMGRDIGAPMVFEEGIAVEEPFVVLGEEPAFPDGRPVERGTREPVWLQVMGLYAALGLLGLVVAHTRLRRAQVSGRRLRRGGRERRDAEPEGPLAAAPAGAEPDRP